ncbi:hypothetical protein ABEG18_12410 [Alsobacter sp. KACC 23698]|uniref:Uncharacterized protein n=1 Tax=Alsobacter sp. KACC 23698 TaxID=3149229 RepID=A0AAU7JM82_9HYPH
MEPPAELTPSRARLAQRLLAASPHREFALRCGSCGLGLVRSGAWIRRHPVFMCGSCFQDTPLDLAALERGAGPERVFRRRSEPQRLALDQPPIRVRPARFIRLRYGASGR